MQFVKLIFVVCFFLVGLSACATAPRLSEEEDTYAKYFSPVESKGSLYVVRYEALGFAVQVPLDINGYRVINSPPGSYVNLHLEPGEYILTSGGENVDSLKISISGGEIIYIWQEIKMGWLKPRSMLHILSEEEGQKRVAQSQLHEPSLYGNEIAPLNSQSTTSKLIEAKSMLDKGLINDEEYQEIKKKLLSDFNE